LFGDHIESSVRFKVSEVEQEIASQPGCWRRTAEVAGRYADVLPAPGERVCAVGCGTSLFIAQAFAAFREQLGLGETDAFPASETPRTRHYDAVLLITRSGTTSEVLDLVPRLPDPDRTIAISATPGTPITESARATVMLDFADESSIVQTRFATSALTLLRAHLGEEIEPLAHAAEQALRTPLPIEPSQFRQFVFVGRGPGAGLANEAALKIRETGGAWSEAYPAMELRHGPMSTLGAHSVVWALGIPPAGLYDDVRLTGAQWVGSDEDPMVALTTIQRVAVRNAQARGLDPDRPKYLSRSVVLP
jgi:fructoselysine-6-P-deglycase FrlB-like protein